MLLPDEISTVITTILPNAAINFPHLKKIKALNAPLFCSYMFSNFKYLSWISFSQVWGLKSLRKLQGLFSNNFFTYSTYFVSKWVNTLWKVVCKFRSSQSHMFFKISVLKFLQYSQGNTYVGVSNTGVLQWILQNF